MDRPGPQRKNWQTRASSDRFIIDKRDFPPLGDDGINELSSDKNDELPVDKEQDGLCINDLPLNNLSETSLSISSLSISSLSIISLPSELIREIFSWLDPKDILALRLVSKETRRVANNNKGGVVWSIKQMRNLKRERPMNYRKFWIPDVARIKGVQKLEELEDFERVNSVQFGKYFPKNRSKENRIMREGFLKNTIILLDFSKSKFNYKIEEESLPKYLTVLIFNNRFNQYIDPKIFSRLRHLKKIRFGKNFNWGIRSVDGAPDPNDSIEIDPNSLPSNLEELIIDSLYFNTDISRLLEGLTNLRTLHLGPGYTQKLEYLSPRLEELCLDDNYNHDLLPLLIGSKLKYLSVGKGYKHYLDPKKLPYGLKIKVDKDSYKEVLFKQFMNNEGRGMLV